MSGGVRQWLGGAAGTEGFFSFEGRILHFASQCSPQEAPHNRLPMTGGGRQNGAAGTLVFEKPDLTRILAQKWFDRECDFVRILVLFDRTEFFYEEFHGEEGRS